MLEVICLVVTLVIGLHAQHLHKEEVRHAQQQEQTKDK